MTNNSLYIKNDRSCFMKITLTTCPTSGRGKQVTALSCLQKQKKKKESCQAVCIVILSVKRAADNVLLDLDINQGAGILLK